MGLDKEILDKQSHHWESTFSQRPDMFGSEPSIAAIKAVKIFKEEKISKILELGSGQGRDTIYFAKNGFQVQALDYSQTAINNIKKKAEHLGLKDLITASKYDVRQSLPFNKDEFDGCFSHMLYCMAFTMEELNFLSKEVLRILKYNCINIYTVRHMEDKDYKNGIHRGEDLYESGNFIVHFFSKEKIKLLSNGFKILNIESFEEGKFPRKLFQVTLRKRPQRL